MKQKTLLVSTGLLLLFLAWSGARPYDRVTWALEIFPIMLVLPLLWATQSDMFFALIGATAALFLFSRFHDRQIRALTTKPNSLRN